MMNLRFISEFSYQKRNGRFQLKGTEWKDTIVSNHRWVKTIYQET